MFCVDFQHLAGAYRPSSFCTTAAYGEGSTVQIRRNTFRSRRSSLSRACCRGLSTEQFCPACTIVLRLRLKTRNVKRIILVCLYVSYSPLLIVQTMLHVIDGMCLKLHVVFLLIVWFSQWSWKSKDTARPQSESIFNN